MRGRAPYEIECQWVYGPPLPIGVGPEQRADPRPRGYLEEALAIARFEPGRYEVVADFAPPG
jgi:hypothetical protein